MELASSSAPIADSEDSKSIGSRAKMSAKRRNICIWISLALVALVVLILVLAFTVFKPKRAVVTINSVAVSDLDVSMDIAKLGIDLNVTLAVDLSVKNPNKLNFKYTNSTALLNYRGELVGEAPIPAGQISAGETKHMNITLTLMADRLLSKSGIISDVISGAIPINTFTRIAGNVKILGVFKVRVVSSSSCDLIVDISSTSISDQRCDYQTKL